MREVLIISGKGGTGKTSLTAAFAHLAADHVICDLDVDTPDLHLLLHPENLKTQEFVSGHTAVITNRCDACGICIDVCQFNADQSQQIKDFCMQKNLFILGELPHDPVFTEAMVRGQTITEYQANGYAAEIRQVWAAIEALIDKPHPDKFARKMAGPSDLKCEVN